MVKVSDIIFYYHLFSKLYWFNF